MDVNVHADPPWPVGRVACNAQRQVRALRADPAEAREHVEVARQLAVEFVQRALGDRVNLAALGAVERAVVDELIDLSRR